MVTQDIAPVRREEKEPARPQAIRRRRQAGFTLIEMLAVVVILAIVAGVGFVVVNNQIENARVNTDKANVRTIADATQRYIMDKGAAPTDVGDLVTNGYLAKAPVDPWDSTKTDAYSISTTDKNVTISGPKPGDSLTLSNVLP
ncbi:hypothetical protein CVV65_15460 [Kyrpidia spormannii]|uniref:Prepilin-type N-terminal cleavage/methylation domain-containing protein n=1 Tax=Kyrpidia spormannii TaxID=2055160 RepID=A0A2K8NCV4_9BACL|nr:prepilin-type N-terminal cleavage/methylation domain-containing protein [Kyrpidia spormannii]ATY86152.1 hypothetical protein CVV65_15460 [Kyrpidia spormannii]